MRRRSVAFAFAVVAAVVVTAMVRAGGGGHDDHRGTTDRLSGYQENPDVSTLGRGSLRIFDIDEDAQTFEFELKYSGLEGAVTVAHIHFGKHGVNGGVSAFLCGGGDKPACPSEDAEADGEAEVTGTIDAADVIGPAGQGIEAGAFDELVAAMRRGNAYANVHSSMWPGGEIRAQISPRNAKH
jgi:hypothetical protein